MRIEPTKKNLLNHLTSFGRKSLGYCSDATLLLLSLIFFSPKSFAQCRFDLNSTNPLMLPWSAQLFDGISGDPELYLDPVTKVYSMYYGAIPGDFSEPERVRIFRATSIDGIKWQRNHLAVLEGSAFGWDSQKVETPAITRSPRGVLYMFYSATAIPDTAVLGYRIGFATSVDGVNWSKYAQPVLVPGVAGAFDELSLFDPTVVYDDLTRSYKMWYAGLSGTYKLAIGTATSTDLIHWQKKGIALQMDVERINTNDFGVMSPSVIKTEMGFEMAYLVAQSKPNYFASPIWMAGSNDGIHWQKYSQLVSSNMASYLTQGLGAPALVRTGIAERRIFFPFTSAISPLVSGGIGFGVLSCK